MRHPRSCNLFFRSSRGCHRKSCSHRHLATQEDPTVLVAGEKVAEDDQRINELNAKIAAQQIQMSELHERLAAQEIQTKELLVSISKLGCKLGNTEASFKRLLETQDIKLSGEIGCLDVQVQRNKKTMKELKPPELSNLISEFTELKTNIDTTIQKVIDEKLDAQKTTIIKVINERQTIHLTAMDSFVKTRLKDQDHLVKSELNKVDTTLANRQLKEEGRLDSIIDIRLEEYTNIIRKQVATVNNKLEEETKTHLANMDVKLTDLTNKKYHFLSCEIDNINGRLNYPRRR